MFNEVKKKAPGIRVKTWKTKDEKHLYVIDQENIIISCQKFLATKPLKVSQKLTFSNLNDICLENSLISKPLYNDCEKARDMRNKIHITGNSNSVKVFTASDIEEISRVILKLIKHFNH